MIVLLRVTSPRSQVLLGRWWIAAWRAVSSQVEGATEAQAEVDTVQAWKSIDQLS